jgi:type II secretory pathway component PulF
VLDASGRTLPPGHRRLLEIAEEGGALARVLDDLAVGLERDRKATARIAQAAAYPAVVLTLLFAMALGFSLWVLPAMAELALVFDAAAAARVRHAARLLSGLTAAGVAGAAAASVAVVGLARASRLPTQTGERIDRALYRLPVLGGVLRARRLATLCLALETALCGGASLEDAVSAAAEAVPGAAFPAACRWMEAALRGGAAFPEVVAATGLFPPVATKWLAAADAGVPMSVVVGELRAHFAAELDERLRWLTRGVEPFLIAVAGAALLVFTVVAIVPVLTAYGDLIS